MAARPRSQPGRRHRGQWPPRLVLLVGSLARLGEGSWSVREGVLSATVDVLTLNKNGTIPIPKNTGRIFIEVGANSLANLYLEELPLFEDAFVISFEPLLHQYSSLMARNTEPGQNTGLGRYHKKAVVLPFAISPEGNTADLRIAGDGDGCASLLKETGKYRPHGFESGVPGCADPNAALEIRRVPAVSLRVVLDAWLRWEDGEGWPIDYLKIDAQGLDVEVLRSSGSLIERIQRVELEINADECELQYEGSMRCSEIVSALADLGFFPAYGQECAHFAGRCQSDEWEFVRAGVLALHDGTLPWREQCWEGDNPINQDFCCRGWPGTLRGTWALEQQKVFRDCWDVMYRPVRCCDLDYSLAYDLPEDLQLAVPVSR